MDMAIFHVVCRDQLHASQRASILSHPKAILLEQLYRLFTGWSGERAEKFGPLRRQALEVFVAIYEGPPVDDITLSSERAGCLLAGQFGESFRVILDAGFSRVQTYLSRAMLYSVAHVFPQLVL